MILFSSVYSYLKFLSIYFHIIDIFINKTSNFTKKEAIEVFQRLPLYLLLARYFSFFIDIDQAKGSDDHIALQPIIGVRNL